LDGSGVELSSEALLHRAMERLYLESSHSERARLFNRAGNKAKLSAAVLKMLNKLQIRIPD
jgi:hypothetical protein